MNTSTSTTPQLPPRRKTQPRIFPALSSASIANIIEKCCGNASMVKRYGAGAHKVFVLPEAYQEFKSMVSYGRRSPMNRLEQKYAGYGHFFVEKTGTVNIVVSHFIQIPTTNRSAVAASNLGPHGEANPGLEFLEYYRKEYQRYEHQFNVDEYGFPVDPFLDSFGPSEFVLEGHTHPDLGVFWSNTDKTSGAARAASSPVCIFVCDPIRQQMLGCVGKDFENAEVIIYDRHCDGNKQSLCVSLEPMTSPVDEIARLANECLRKRGCSGKIKCGTRLDGKVHMRIKMVIPKGSKRK